jgi:hypothetical protein
MGQGRNVGPADLVTAHRSVLNLAAPAASTSPSIQTDQTST